MEAKMAIYLIKHPDPNYKGSIAGIDFDNGIGSTNCLQYAEEAARIIGGQVIEPTNKETEEKIIPEKKVRKK
jgi:hypothetical protein